MNIGDWRIRQNDKGDCIFSHKNLNTNEFETVKTYKNPKTHILSKQSEQSSATSNNTKTKKCIIL